MSRSWVAAIACVALTAAVEVRSADAGPGDADTTFGTNGRVTTEVNGATSYAHRLLVQDDKKLVVVGTAGGGFAVARYLETGALDPDFGTGGFVQTTFGSAPEAWGIVRQPADGKYVVCGHDGTSLVLIRYTDAGVYDGIVKTTFQTVVAGYSIARHDSDGAFIVAGYAPDPQNQVALALFRFTSNGALDTSFGSNGVAASPFRGLAAPVDMVMLPDETVVTTTTRDATSHGVFGIAHFRLDGSLDATFGTSGVATAPLQAATALGLTRQTDKKIVVVGQAFGDARGEFAVARFNENGSLDAKFGTNGAVLTNFPGYLGLDAAAQDVCVQADGKIVAVGELADTLTVVHFALARYAADGSPDRTFGQCGVLVVDWGGRSSAEACAIDASGRLDVAGGASIRSVPDIAVARFDLSGAHATTACGAGGTISSGVDNSLPPTSGVTNRKQLKVAKKLNGLLKKAIATANKSDRQKGKKRVHTLASVRKILQSMLTAAQKAAAKGTLGIDLQTLTDAINSAIAIVPTS